MTKHAVRRTRPFVAFFFLVGLLMAMMPGVANAGTTTPYTGQGMTVAGPESEKCGAAADTGQDTGFVISDDGSYLKWVFTGSDASYVKLHGPWGTFDMIATPGGGAWHKATDYYPLSDLVPDKVWAEHDATGNVQLVVSNGCAGLQGDIEVTKTAVPTFTREHEWKIDKTVTTENEHLLDGVPKIWLYADGSGDEKATWNVDVDYDGYTDSDWNVSGVITIKNTGDLPATVTSVLDKLQTLDRSTTPVTVESYEPDLTCPELPQDLAVGAELTCTYSQDLPSGLPGVNIAGTFGYFDGDMTDKFNEATGPVRFAFGEPTTETNETVNVKDVSGLFGEKDLGSVTAPNGDTFSYDKTFSWEDYGQEQCGSHQYVNTATIVETGQSDDASLKVNVQCYEFESAWAMGTGEGVTAQAFSDFGFSNWGWTNLIGQPYSGEWPLYAGAAQSDPSKGTLVGTFSVSYNGGFSYDFDIDPGYLVDDEAVYAGADPFPKLRKGGYTTAPGQYTVMEPLSGDIYVIAHANVGIPDPDFGPSLN